MSSIAIGIVILIVIIAAIVIYFVVVNNEAPEYPISIFNFDDNVNITPITLTQNGNIISTNQYLQKLTTGDPSCINTQGDGYNNMGANACVALFTGNADQPQSKWILRQFKADGSGDANQSLKSGYGNRFYLQNSTQPDKTAYNGRLMYSPLNFFITRVNSCAYTTAATIGYNDNNKGEVGFSTEMMLYFMPTTYKDIYYILFPACLDSDYNNNDMPNNGIISIRPWANNSGQFILDETNCATCPAGGTYTPYNNGVLYPNAMIANLLPNNGETSTIPPYDWANIVLFKVTIAD